MSPGEPDLDPARPDPADELPATAPVSGHREAPPSERPPLGGRVQSEGGQVLEGAVVEVRERRNLFTEGMREIGSRGETIRLLTSSDGSFSVPRKPGFLYELVVQAEGYGSAVVRPFAGSFANVILPASRELRGVVRRLSDATGIAGVSLHAMAGGYDRIAVTGADGRYSFPGLPAGFVTVQLSHPKFVPQTILVDLGSSPGTSSRDISLHSGSVVRGTVSSLSAAAPVPGAVVTARQRGVGTVTGTVICDPEGQYELRSLLPGVEYDIEATAEGSGSAQAIVTVPVDGTAMTVDLLLEDTWTLVGTVFAPDDGISAGSVVQAFALLSGDTSISGEAVCDASGSFSIPDLPGQGEVDVVVMHPDYAIEVVFDLRRDTHEGITVEIHLSLMAVLSGVVHDPAGQPVSGVLVRATPQGPEGDGGTLPPLYTFSDETGHYELANLPAGPCQIRTLRSGYRGTSLLVELSAGVTSTTDLQISPYDRASLRD